MPLSPTPLAGVLDDAAYNGDAAATTGSGVLYQPGPDLDRDLSPGGTATVTYSVTVSNPDTGRHPVRHGHLAVAGEQLRLGEHRPAVHHHGDGVGADDRFDGRRGDRDARARRW